MQNAERVSFALDAGAGGQFRQVATLKTAHRSKHVQQRPRTAGQVPIAGPAAARPLLVGEGDALGHCVRDSTLDCVQVCKGVGIYSGLDGSSGVPTVLGVLVA